MMLCEVSIIDFGRLHLLLVTVLWCCWVGVIRCWVTGLDGLDVMLVDTCGVSVLLLYCCWLSSIFTSILIIPLSFCLLLCYLHYSYLLL